MHAFVSSSQWYLALTERVANYFQNLITDHEHYDIAKAVETTMKSFCHVVNRINHASEDIGKDGRFQIFILIGVRYWHHFSFLMHPQNICCSSGIAISNAGFEFYPKFP
jgi:hypothetical protein